jgi:PAT family beta-lactamase induction signal transducer AmpG
LTSEAEVAAPAPKGTAAWVTTTYLAEGLPYMIVRFLSGVYFTDIGAKEALIGYLNFLGVPWNFKFLWAPLVDFWGTRRGWMVTLQLLIGAAVGILAVLAGFGPHEQSSAGSQPIARLEWADLATAVDATTGLSHQTIIMLMIGVLVVLAFLSATNDVAIDAFYIEALPNRRDQAGYSGIRTMAYRIAMVFARIVLISFAWTMNFALGAVVMIACGLLHAFFPRRTAPVVVSERPRLLAHFGRAFAAYLQQPRLPTVLLFIATYKLGDELLFSMGSTFLLREIHVTKQQLGLLAGFIGLATTVVGTMLGAYWIKRVGLRRSIWPLTLGMNLNIWVYVWVAWAKPNPATTSGFLTLAVTHGYENFARGLGDAVLTVFLLYLCKPSFKATHYAIGSAIMSLGGNLAGGFGGALVERMGYVNLYILAFISSIPSMLLILRLPLRGMENRSSG